MVQALRELQIKETQVIFAVSTKQSLHMVAVQNHHQSLPCLGHISQQGAEQHFASHTRKAGALSLLWATYCYKSFLKKRYHIEYEGNHSIAMD